MSDLNGNDKGKGFGGLGNLSGGGKNDEPKKEGAPKGFDGLSKPPQAQPEIPASSPQPQTVVTPSKQAANTGSPASSQSQTQPPSKTQVNSPPNTGNDSNSGCLVLFLIAVFVGGLLLMVNANKSGSSNSHVAGNTVPSRPAEQTPSIGRGLSLNDAQIRYCLAEEIRLDGAKTTASQYDDLDVNRYNSMVGDYNSRCGEFRYRSGALERAKREIEPWRSQLYNEGRQRFISVVPTPQAAQVQSPSPAYSQQAEVISPPKVNRPNRAVANSDFMADEPARPKKVQIEKPAEDSGFQRYMEEQDRIQEARCDRNEKRVSDWRTGAYKCVKPGDPEYR